MSVETARAIVVLSTCDHADQVRFASCCTTYMGVHMLPPSSWLPLRCYGCCIMGQCCQSVPVPPETCIVFLQYLRLQVGRHTIASVSAGIALQLPARNRRNQLPVEALSTPLQRSA